MMPACGLPARLAAGGGPPRVLRRIFPEVICDLRYRLDFDTPASHGNRARRRQASVQLVKTYDDLQVFQCLREFRGEAVVAEFAGARVYQLPRAGNQICFTSSSGEVCFKMRCSCVVLNLLLRAIACSDSRPESRYDERRSPLRFVFGDEVLGPDRWHLLATDLFKPSARAPRQVVCAGAVVCACGVHINMRSQACRLQTLAIFVAGRNARRGRCLPRSHRAAWHGSWLCRPRLHALNCSAWRRAKRMLSGPLVLSKGKQPKRLLAQAPAIEDGCAAVDGHRIKLPKLLNHMVESSDGYREACARKTLRRR